LHAKESALLVTHQSRKVSFKGIVRCVSSLVCGQISGEEMLFVSWNAGMSASLRNLVVKQTFAEEVHCVADWCAN